MKTIIILTVIGWLAAPVFAAPATNDATALVERGLFEEEANHQFDAAIADYKEAIAQFDHERQLAATAVFHLAECYRKEGKTNEAAVEYQRILRDFSDQTTLATLSQQDLTGLGMPPAAAASRQQQKELLTRQIALAQQHLADVKTSFQTGLATGSEVYAAESEVLRLQQQLAALQASQPWLTAAGAPGTPSGLPPDEEKFLLKVKESAQDSPDLMAGELQEAASNGYVSGAEFLVGHGVDVNERATIVVAAQSGNERMVQLLLDHGASVDRQDENGHTALGRAVGEGFLAVCRALVTHGADVNAKDTDGQTPLYIAVDKEQITTAAFLITNKADLNARGYGGWTPLTLAFHKGEVEMVQLLLRNHADANMTISPRILYPNIRGGQVSPLGLAIGARSPEMVGLLLMARADPNAEFVDQSSANVTPLISAVEFNAPDSTKMVQMLLVHGAKPNAVDWSGEPALDYAINMGNSEAVLLLIAHGADVNLVDKDGRPPLAYLKTPLTGSGREIQDLLVKAGADVDYNRRRGIWLGNASGAPEVMVFSCPSNSINHYTLFDFIAATYKLADYFEESQPPWLRTLRPGMRVFANSQDSSNPPFPDFAHITIHRLEGQREEVLPVNLADFFQSGDCSKNVALRTADVIDIPEQEHKAAESWGGLSLAEATNLNTCLLRVVRIVVKGTTNSIALLASPKLAMKPTRRDFSPQPPPSPERAEWLVKALNGRKADATVGSFVLNDVLAKANVLLNTSDLSRVRLTRGSEKMTFDLTQKPPPEVQLEDGDLIEVPDMEAGAPSAGN